MADETLYVDPAFVRIAGSEVTGIGGELRDDFGRARGSLDSEATTAGWAVLGAASTLDKLWQTYLSGLGSTIDDYGDRLRAIADAYERCDEEAAEALGVALPEDGPVVKDRPGHVPE